MREGTDEIGRLLRLPEVEKQVGLKRTAIYEAIKAGTFPPSVACDPTHKNQLRAAELILEHVRPDHVEQAVSQDVRVIADYAQTHGWSERIE